MLRYIQETPAQVRANIAASARLTQRMGELYLSRPYRTVWLGGLRLKLQCRPLRTLLHEAIPGR